MNVTFEDIELIVHEDAAHEWLLDTELVAKGYGVTDSNIRKHKMKKSDELIEGKHFITVTNGNGGEPKTLWTKRGVVRLGFGIRSDRAAKFRDWAEDLIIKIAEVTKPESDDELLSRALVLANSKLANMQTRLVQAERTIELQAPKVEYVDAVLNSDGCMNTTEIAAEFSWSARRLNLELQRMGVQYKTNGHWVLTHKYKEHEQRTGQKYTETRTILTESKSTGEVKSRIDRVWTQRGRALIWWLIKQDAAMKQKALGTVE